MIEEQKIPKYTFAEVPEGTINPASPIKKQIAKTMEVTELFTMYDVLKYVGAVDKSIADKEAEIEALKTMKKAYLDEISIVEKQLNVSNLEEEFQKALAEEFKSEPEQEVNLDGLDEVAEDMVALEERE